MFVGGALETSNRRNTAHDEQGPRNGRFFLLADEVDQDRDRQEVE
jgi:hypothetical protein